MFRYSQSGSKYSQLVRDLQARNRHTQCAAAERIKVLAREDANRGELIKAGVVAGLKDLLGSSDNKTVMNALAALNNLSISSGYGRNENLRSIAAAGLSADFVRLTKHPDAEVRKLTIIQLDSILGDRDARDFVGFPRELLKASVECLSDREASVRKAAVRTLRNRLDKKDSSLLLEPRRMAALLNCLNSHDAEVKMDVVLVLVCLSKEDSSIRQAIYQSQGIPKLVSVMREGARYSGNAGHLLWLLGRDRDGDKRSAVASQVYSAVRSKLSHLSKDDTSTTLRFLSLIVQQHDLLDKLCRDNALADIVRIDFDTLSDHETSADSEHPSDKRLWADVVTAIAAHSQSAKDQLARAGFIESFIARAKKANKSDRDCSVGMASAITMLVTMIRNHRGNQDRFAGAGGFTAILDGVWGPHSFNTYYCSSSPCGVYPQYRRACAQALQELIRDPRYHAAFNAYRYDKGCYGKGAGGLAALEKMIELTGRPEESDIKGMLSQVKRHMEQANQAESRRQAEEARRRAEERRRQAEKTAKTSSGAGKGSSGAADDLVICEKIGEGGFAVVHRGQLGGQQVAVKQLKVGEISPDNKAMMEKEAEFLKQLNHKNIVAFLRLKIESRACQLIMEYMPLGSLYHLLTSTRPLDKQQRLGFAFDVSSGIAYLHSRRPAVIHGDLKSLNVLVRKRATSAGEELQACLADFGLATARQETMTHALQTSSAKGGVAGTPAFMAPEMLDPDIQAKASRSTDRYAQAMVLWEIATRKIAWAGMNPFAMMRCVDRGRRPAISDSAMTPDYKRLVETCWQQDPKARPSAAAVVEALEQERGVLVASR